MKTTILTKTSAVSWVAAVMLSLTLWSPITMAAAGSATSTTASSAAQSGVKGHTLKPFHQKLSCEACHQEKAPSAPTVVNCTGCHGSPEKVAERTAPRYKQYYNPHNSLHYATYADCVACHREHSASVLDCNSSNCHREFTLKTP